jgi:hypothetical protein
MLALTSTTLEKINPEAFVKALEEYYQANPSDLRLYHEMALSTKSAIATRALTLEEVC